MFILSIGISRTCEDITYESRYGAVEDVPTSKGVDYHDEQQKRASWVLHTFGNLRQDMCRVLAMMCDALTTIDDQSGEEGAQPDHEECCMSVGKRHGHAGDDGGYCVGFVVYR